MLFEQKLVTIGNKIGIFGMGYCACEAINQAVKGNAWMVLLESALVAINFYFSTYRSESD